MKQSYGVKTAHSSPPETIKVTSHAYSFRTQRLTLRFSHPPHLGKDNRLNPLNVPVLVHPCHGAQSQRPPQGVEASASLLQGCIVAALVVKIGPVLHPWLAPLEYRSGI